MTNYEYVCECGDKLEYDDKTDEYYCTSCGFRISRGELN